MLDFLAGPIWTGYIASDKYEYISGERLLENDTVLNELNEEIQNLYSSYYHFDYNDLPCYFDEEQEKKDKGKMLNLLSRLLHRLDELNDGSFEVEDLETPRIQAL